MQLMNGMTEERVATEAAQLQAHPVFQSLMLGIESDALEELLTTTPDQDVRRQVLIDRIKFVRDMESNLEYMKAAFKQSTARQSMKERYV